MKIIISTFCFFLITSFGSDKVIPEAINSAQDNYTIRMKNARLSPHFLGGGKLKYGAPKNGIFELKDAIELYELEITIFIDGLSKQSIVDFNNFSLIEHKNKYRHRPQFASFHTAFSGYAASKITLKEFTGEDIFLKYSQTEFENYDHFRLPPNSVTQLTKKSIQKAKQYRFKKTSLPRNIVRKKTFTLGFYTRIKKEGEFSLYYKDKLVKKFTADKKMKKF